MDTNELLIIKNIDRLFAAIHHSTTFRRKINQVFPEIEDIPDIDEITNFYISTIWDMICKLRGIPELSEDEFMDFDEDCVSFAFSSSSSSESPSEKLFKQYYYIDDDWVKYYTGIDELLLN